MTPSPIEIKTIQGNPMKLDGGAMFGNAPKALWSRWVSCDDANRIDIGANCLLIRSGDQVILFETGPGAYLSPKMKDRFGVVSNTHVLLESLAEQGVSHEEVTHVILSHLHFDHSGGLLSAYQEGQSPRLLFPRARFVAGKANFERSCSPRLRDRASFIPELNTQLKESGRLDLVEAGDELNLDGVNIRFTESRGHTPGMLISWIEVRGTHLIFIGDLVPGSPWMNLPITMGYDRYPEALVEEKEAMLARALDMDAWLVYPHDGQYAASRLALNPEKKRYVPTALTPELALTL